MIQIDMEMPRDCEECPLTYPIHDGGAEYCCLTDVPEYIYRYGERPADCPLREVEDPWLDLQKKLEQWMAENKIKWYTVDDECLDTDDITRGGGRMNHYDMPAHFYTMLPGLFDHWTNADFLVHLQSMYNEARCKGMPRDEEIEEEIRDLRRKVEREVEG